MRIFSGIQPTGNLHIGNYLGATKNWVKLQDTGAECIYCVVDQHAITLWKSPENLRQYVYEMTANLLASGIDARKHILFNQSRVAEHAQLAWVMNCVARMGWMSRMTQFKDKAGPNRENVSLGLFAYPSLMAADILLYKATHVPVGEDQKQHVELTRDIAIKFNHDYKTELFPIPDCIIREGSRIMSLRDGTKKMSKSDPSDMSRINMMDDADTIRQKIKKAKTDPDHLPETLAGLNGRPEAENLLTMYACLKDMTLADAVVVFAGKQFSALKDQLADACIAELVPISTEMRKILQDKAYLDQVLSNGADRARAIASPILREVYDTVGFLQDVR